MSLTRRALFCTLALLAMAWAQIVGLQRGYVCDCGGQEVITAWDHCDGPHGSTCHEQEAAEAPHSKAAHHGPENTQDHATFREQIVASQSSIAKRVVIEPVLFTAWAPLPDMSSIPARRLFIADRAHTSDPPRPWPAVLAHTIALRI